LRVFSTQAGGGAVTHNACSAGLFEGHFHDVHCRRTMIYDVVMVEFEELREQTNFARPSTF
jgi:hypothetical protein